MPVTKPSHRVSRENLDPGTVDVLVDLRTRYPEAPFLTLGQTVLWDEPVKAAFCRVLEILEGSGDIPGGARIVAGVHDTDYFAKLPGLGVSDTPFVVLRHNDGDTRGLWSAAGEISALFGAEVVPSRAMLAHYGVGFHAAAKAYPGGSEALLNQETEAPLWRAIVHTEDQSLIAADVKLADIAPALRQQLNWAFRQSLRSLNCDEALDSDEPCASRGIARQILAWVDQYCALEPEGTLSDLYRDLIPKIWSLVRGGAACRLETTASMELFRFNGQTAASPRFHFVDIFLNPATRSLARRAYDEAVRGSGIYTLDGFGEGALPFDVVIPGRGRGTLRLEDGALSIETEIPIQLCDGCDPESVGQLAGILERQLGPDIALVGKAVALIPMLAAEFIFVFHEKASGYTSRTQRMTAALRGAGVDLDLFPMLRLKHSTWDALDGVDAKFKLPAHLAGVMGRSEMSATEFAANWRQTVAGQRALLERLGALRAPGALMGFLCETRREDWIPKCDQYQTARHAISLLRTGLENLEPEITTSKQWARENTELGLRAERAKGDHFRAEIAPLRVEISRILETAASGESLRVSEGMPRLTKEEQALKKIREAQDDARVAELRAAIAAFGPRRREFDAEIERFRTQARAHKLEARAATRKKLLAERGPEARAARDTMRRLEAEAQLERLKMTRDAIWAIDTLEYGNYRPTAWWLPMVSPDGVWFEQIAGLTRAHVEEL